MNDKVLSLLGLMRKAGVLDVTEASCKQSVLSGKSKLILVASDASETLIRRFSQRAACNNIQSVELKYSKVELSNALGCNLCSVISINDSGFSEAIKKLL